MLATAKFDEFDETMSSIKTKIAEVLIKIAFVED